MARDERLVMMILPACLQTLQQQHTVCLLEGWGMHLRSLEMLVSRNVTASARHCAVVCSGERDEVALLLKSTIDHLHCLELHLLQGQGHDLD